MTPTEEIVGQPKAHIAFACGYLQTFSIQCAKHRMLAALEPKPHA